MGSQNLIIVVNVQNKINTLMLCLSGLTLVDAGLAHLPINIFNNDFEL